MYNYNGRTLFFRHCCVNICRNSYRARCCHEILQKETRDLLFIITNTTKSLVFHLVNFLLIIFFLAPTSLKSKVYTFNHDFIGSYLKCWLNGCYDDINWRYRGKEGKRNILHNLYNYPYCSRKISHSKNDGNLRFTVRSMLFLLLILD